MKRILITGMNCYIGNSFESYLKKWPEAFRIDKITLRNDSWKKRNFSDYDVVFHVAGIAHSDSGEISPEKAKLYYKVNTDLTIEIAKKAKSEGVKQFVFMSSAIVYGDSSPVGRSKIITRETPVSPSNSYGDSKVQAEKGILQLENENFKVVIIRSPMIYGRGVRAIFRFFPRWPENCHFFRL